MKKAMILEEGDYNLVMTSLSASKDVLKRMSQTKNVRRVAYHIDAAVRVLTEDDSSTRDIKDRLSFLELQTND